MWTLIFNQNSFPRYFLSAYDEVIKYFADAASHATTQTHTVALRCPMGTPKTVAPNGGTGEQQSDTMDGSKSTEKQENLLERCLTKSSDSTVTIMRAHVSAVGPVQVVLS